MLQRPSGREFQRRSALPPPAASAPPSASASQAVGGAELSEEGPSRTLLGAFPQALDELQLSKEEAAGRSEAEQAALLQQRRQEASRARDVSARQARLPISPHISPSPHISARQARLEVPRAREGVPLSRGPPLPAGGATQARALTTSPMKVIYFIVSCTV